MRRTGGRATRASLQALTATTATALLLAACGGEEAAAPATGSAAGSAPATATADPPSPPSVAATAPSTAAAAPTGTASEAPDPTSTFTDATATGAPDASAAQDVVTGLDVPWDLAFLPDGTALVTLRDQQRVVHVTPDGQLQPVAAEGEDGRVSGVAPGGEGGLLGITTDVGAEHVYVYLSAPEENRVVRYDFDRDALALTDPSTVLDGIPRSEVHNGGRIDLGPDGHLYVATGDARDEAASQEPGSLAGKILRVTTDGEPAPGNPDPTSPVWSSGHRNVQGLGWSAADGTMWASEFGQNRTDELNAIAPGNDYGWPQVEGTGGGERFTDPVATWGTDEASPSGIAVTDDAVYLAALRGQRLWRVPVRDGEVAGEPEVFLDGYGRLRHVELAPDGKSLWVLTSNTFRGDPREGDDRILRVPLG
ncbi:PQQ-dependent sugar dehydrogenase [Aquipuribacter nitratireducens]|uniref:PQQ-dependent sugar dehydrogenase n=1 Tax=Aquipuribacter nitratireducens TaxID=650104 RepID=A0ABW0GLT5_9MICO